VNFAEHIAKSLGDSVCIRDLRHFVSLLQSGILRNTISAEQAQRTSVCSSIHLWRGIQLSVKEAEEFRGTAQSAFKDEVVITFGGITSASKSLDVVMENYWVKDTERPVRFLFEFDLHRCRDTVEFSLVTRDQEWMIPLAFGFTVSEPKEEIDNGVKYLLIKLTDCARRLSTEEHRKWCRERAEHLRTKAELEAVRAAFMAEQEAHRETLAKLEAASAALAIKEKENKELRGRPKGNGD
jgi:hypothetical protein